MNKNCHLIAQDAVANRVYQAFERLQIAWYAANARQVDEAAIRELNAAEEEWLAARDSVSVGF